MVIDICVSARAHAYSMYICWPKLADLMIGGSFGSVLRPVLCYFLCSLLAAKCWLLLPCSWFGVLPCLPLWYVFLTISFFHSFMCVHLSASTSLVSSSRCFAFFGEAFQGFGFLPEGRVATSFRRGQMSRGTAG